MTTPPANHVPDPETPAYDETGREPLATSEAARPAGPVQRNAQGGWTVLGHAEAARVARDADTFSSAVSRFLQVPNGLDGDEHRAFREATDHYFGPDEMARFEPVLRSEVRGFVDALRPRVAEAVTGEGQGMTVDAVGEVGAVLAVRGQVSWLGWPRELEPRLLDWMAANHAASRSGELARTAAVAQEFDAIIREVVAPRRGQEPLGAVVADAPDDVTTALLRQRVAPPDAPEGRPLSDAEVVSILRNWTGGDLGSIALCVGVLLTGLTRMPELADRIAEGVSHAELAAIVDELLRIDDPFVANRRVATCPVTVAGQQIAAGERVVLHWTSANRDAEAFPDPDAFDPHGNAERNLVYGTGPHVCPGRPLATLELCVAVEEIVRAFALSPADVPGDREVAPVGGWAVAPVTLRPRE